VVPGDDEFQFRIDGFDILLARLKLGKPPTWVRSPQCRRTPTLGAGLVGENGQVPCVSDRRRKRIVRDMFLEVVVGFSKCLSVGRVASEV
jgi:hypothetical protein